MSRRAQENLVAVVLLAFFAGVIWLCQDFGPRARMIPLPLAILGIALTLVQFAWQNLRSTEELQMHMVKVDTLPAADADRSPAASAATPAGARSAPSWQRETGAYGIVAALLGGILVLGVVPAVFLFTGAYLVLTRYRSWRASLIYTAIFTAAVYLLFFVALQIQPYHGLLATLFD